MHQGVIVHEDTPRKVMYVTHERIPTPTAESRAGFSPTGAGHRLSSEPQPQPSAAAEDEGLSRSLF